MIKVNLLAQPRGVEAPREWIPRDQRSAFTGLAMLLGTGVLVTGWWYYLHDQRSDLDLRIAAADSEISQLKDAAVLVEQAQQRRAELGERLALIERLRAGKRGPVTLIETINYSVPEGLWLIELKQTGAAVQIDGRAMSLTAVTDFAERLQTSGLFKRPVDIVTTVAEVFEQANVVRFVVRAEADGVIAPVDLPASKPGARPGA
jgi:type IV pilus assembly protein PilN